MASPPASHASRARTLALAALAVGLLAAAAWAAVEGGALASLRSLWNELGSAEGIQRWVAGFGAAAPLAMFALLALQAIAAPIPAAAAAAASGLLFGPWTGTLLAVAGVTTGSALAFLLARRLGRPWVVRLVSPQALARLDGFVHRRGAAALFLIFLIPFLPDDVACFAAGLSPIPFRLFVAVLVTARTPAVVVGSLTGAGLVRGGLLLWAGLAALTLLGLAILSRYEERLWRWLERPRRR
ncbi:MAG TPA: VTT domain-containing protein [Limnochorda sp.]